MGNEDVKSEAELVPVNENELSEEEKVFVKRFNLKPQDLQYKQLAELETETQ